MSFLLLYCLQRKVRRRNSDDELMPLCPECYAFVRKREVRRENVLFLPGVLGGTPLQKNLPSMPSSSLIALSILSSLSIKTVTVTSVSQVIRNLLSRVMLLLSSCRAAVCWLWWIIVWKSWDVNIMIPDLPRSSKLKSLKAIHSRNSASHSLPSYRLYQRARTSEYISWED